MTAQQREGYGKYFAARALVFCSLFYLYIRLWVDPLLLYHVQEPPFFFGWNFFADLAAYPGGLSEYLSSFLSQFYFFPWFGALCITAIVGLICLCTRTYITALGGARFLPTAAQDVLQELRLVHELRPAWVPPSEVPLILLLPPK